jgi:hypothetical protein
LRVHGVADHLVADHHVNATTFLLALNPNLGAPARIASATWDGDMCP